MQQGKDKKQNHVWNIELVDQLTKQEKKNHEGTKNRKQYSRDIIVSGATASWVAIAEFPSFFFDTVIPNEAYDIVPF